MGDCNLFIWPTFKFLKADMIARMKNPTQQDPSTEPSDETLMLNVLQGNQAAFNQLVRNWKQPLVNYFFRHLGQAETAEELTQEVFVRLWKVKKYQVKARFSTWIYRLAHNILIDHWRKQGRSPQKWDAYEALLELSTTEAGPEQLALEQETCLKIQTALRSLPNKQQEILVLSKFQDLKYSQIAEILNCPAEQVKVQVFRAVQNLGKKLKEVLNEKR
jgi:RNA polymerase sigma factor (sigma-70 family)